MSFKENRKSVPEVFEFAAHYGKKEIRGTKKE